MIHMRSVVRALQRARIPYKEGGRKLVHIWCPFHPDKATPSLVIYTNQTPPTWYCFGCRAHGTWNDLDQAIQTGQLEKDWEDPNAPRNWLEDLKDLISLEPALPPLTRPWVDGDYRGFSAHILTCLLARWWYDEIDRVRRLVWPVWNRQSDLVGWVARDLDNLDDSERKYRNMPHMEALATLYPLPLEDIYPERTVILVEGITDAIRLLQVGLPAQAILGTTWSKTRTNLLHVMNIYRVILAFDPDSAGEEAREHVGSALSSEFDVFTWEWPDKKDPGDADPEVIEELRNEVDPQTPNDLHPWLAFTPKIVPSTWFVNKGVSYG